MEPASTSLPGNAPLLLGPPLIGVALNWWLYGIFVMQYFMYLNNSSRDGAILRGVVHFLFLLDTAQTIMIMDDTFFWFVRNFGDIKALRKFNLASLDGPLLDAIITFTVQLVYCWRLRIIGKWKVLPVISAMFALLSCVSGMLVGIRDKINPTNFKTAAYVWLFAGAFTDILIASSMAYLLMKYRKANTSQTTMAIVKRILLLILETNALTAALAIALVTVFLVPSVTPPVTNVYLALGYTLGKMYSNCFMVLLNQRIYYDGPKGSTSESETFSSVSHRSRGFISRNRDGLSHPNPALGQISVIRFTETRTDEPSAIELNDTHKATNGQDFKSSSDDFA